MEKFDGDRWFVVAVFNFCVVCGDFVEINKLKLIVGVFCMRVGRRVRVRKNLTLWRSMVGCSVLLLNRKLWF